MARRATRSDFGASSQNSRWRRKIREVDNPVSGRKDSHSVVANGKMFGYPQRSSVRARPAHHIEMKVRPQVRPNNGPDRPERIPDDHSGSCDMSEEVSQGTDQQQNKLVEDTTQQNPVEETQQLS